MHDCCSSKPLVCSSIPCFRTDANFRNTSSPKHPAATSSQSSRGGRTLLMHIDCCLLTTLITYLWKVNPSGLNFLKNKCRKSPRNHCYLPGLVGSFPRIGCCDDCSFRTKSQSLRQLCNRSRALFAHPEVLVLATQRILHYDV